MVSGRTATAYFILIRDTYLLTRETLDLAGPSIVALIVAEVSANVVV